MKQTFGVGNEVIDEALELLGTIESAFAHYQERIHSVLGRIRRDLAKPA